MDPLDKILDSVVAEYNRATVLYPGFASQHEGYAILLEEVEELWDEIKKNPRTRDPAATRREAIQVAAMALRFLRDCTTNE